MNVFKLKLLGYWGNQNHIILELTEEDQLSNFSDSSLQETTMVDFNSGHEKLECSLMGKSCFKK